MFLEIRPGTTKPRREGGGFFAAEQNRTADTWIFSPLLYQLSYSGADTDRGYQVLSDLSTAVIGGVAVCRGDAGVARRNEAVDPAGLSIKGLGGEASECLFSVSF